MGTFIDHSAPKFTEVRYSDPGVTCLYCGHFRPPGRSCMRKNWLWAALLPGLLIGVTGCPDVKVDPDEVGSAGPIIEFDPSNKIIPFPNNLLLDPATGRVNLPAQCNESPTSKATREGVLNQLDGFG